MSSLGLIRNTSIENFRQIIWAGLSFVSNQGIAFLGSILLSRYLSDESFGVYHYYLAFILIFEVIINNLSYNHLISLPILSKKSLNTAFSIGFFTSISFAIIICIYAYFFVSSDIQTLIFFLTISLPVESILVVYKARLSFYIQFVSQTVVSIVSGICTLLLVFYTTKLGFGLYALVVLKIAPKIISVIVYPIYLRWFPSISWHKMLIFSQLNLSWKFALSGTISMVSTSLVNIILGSSFGFLNLGQYSRAVLISNIPNNALGEIISKVSVPMLRKTNIQDSESLINIMMYAIAYVSFVVMLLLFIFRSELIDFLLGAGWEQAKYYLSLTSILIYLFPIQVFMMSLLIKNRNGRRYLYIEIAKKIVFLVSIVITSFYSIVAMIVAMIFSSVVSFFINYYGLRKEFGFSWNAAIGIIFLGALGIGCMITLGGYDNLGSFLVFIEVLLLGLVGFVISKKFYEYFSFSMCDNV